MALTDTLIKNTKSQDKSIKMFDGGGLFLLVTPNGGKWWRLKYYFEKKEKLISLGTYPAVSLKDARKKREKAKEQLAAGIDPGAQRKEKQAVIKAEEKAVEGLFENVAKEWFNSYSPSLTKKHADKLQRYLQADILPALGKRHVDDIEADHVTSL